jgi:hypothetical protein
MPALPQVDHDVVEAIYEAYRERGEAELPRAYLGASVIGDECERKLWYGMRWATLPEFDGRMYRLFQTGHLEEPRLIRDLRDIGATVYERDPATGRQFAYSDLWGHFRGSTDGLAHNLPNGQRMRHVLEFKTHSAKSFAELKRLGVRLSKPLHYAQMQVYMAWAKVSHALYLARNKDTDELYAEHIENDPVLFDRLRTKAERIIFAALPPPRLSDDPAFYKCKMCDHHAVCHGDRVPRKSCRTCVHASPVKTGDGAWECARYQIQPTHEQQFKGCESHLPLPPLVQYAEPLDAGDEWILMRHRTTNKVFMIATANSVIAPEVLAACGEPVIYQSAEICAARADVITDDWTDAVRREFNARIKP